MNKPGGQVICLIKVFNIAKRFNRGLIFSPLLFFGFKDKWGGDV